jgi:hypothetical protein
MTIKIFDKLTVIQIDMNMTLLLLGLSAICGIFAACMLITTQRKHASQESPSKAAPVKRTEHLQEAARDLGHFGSRMPR